MSSRSFPAPLKNNLLLHILFAFVPSIIVLDWWFIPVVHKVSAFVFSLDRNKKEIPAAFACIEKLHRIVCSGLKIHKKKGKSPD